GGPAPDFDTLRTREASTHRNNASPGASSETARRAHPRLRGRAAERAVRFGEAGFRGPRVRGCCSAGARQMPDTMTARNLTERRRMPILRLSVPLVRCGAN